MRNLPFKPSTLMDQSKERILVLDGAMGTCIQAYDLSGADFGGEALNGCNEYLVVTRPDVIQAIHEAYLEAGADIVETNTFGGTSVVLAEYDIQDKVVALNSAAVKLARQACDKYSTPDRPRYVAGSIGPTTKALSVTGGITFDKLVTSFEDQAYVLTDAGSDYLLLETALDTLNLKAAYVGICQAFDRLGYRIPVAVSVTIETMGTMLAGQGVEAMYAAVEHMEPLYIGLNCATGPEFMKDHIRTLSAISRFPVSVVPNAGIPDAEGVYPESAKALSATLEGFVDEGWVNFIGGCCGTTPEHIRMLADMVAPKSPRIPVVIPQTRLSGIEPLVLEEDSRPYIVGERTNVIGSRAFKVMVADEKYEEAAEIARKQVRAGAHIIDVCLSNPDRDEVTDMREFLKIVTKYVKVPFMIDSQMPAVVEEAFKWTQGKCILNSVNLEDGEKSFEELLPIVKQYGASIVVGCISGEMAVTAAEKLKVAEESYHLLTTKYGIREENIAFDPLVFPCGTGDKKYFGSGFETIEGVRLIKERFPLCKTVLGISNISFGLPGAGREVLNSVFLYHCTKAGLDMAIVNSEKLVRYSQITDEEKQLCDDLLWYRTENGNDPIANFATYFREKKVVETQEEIAHLPVEKRLEINIVQGTKEGLIANLEEALTQWDPLGVINIPLMAGMDIVGDLFGKNELIVAEVLQSAEVMKTAVTYLEQFMEKNEANVRGIMLLATVKGDVHDIGKNLVQIILGNNGYRIIDLGIKCPPEKLIEGYHEHKPTLIGLSGLLVKSAQQMVTTASDLKAAGIEIPILVGGAALTEMFTVSKIAPQYGGSVIYCKDAMTGLSVSNQLSDPATREGFLTNLSEKAAATLEQKPVPTSTAKREYKEKLVFDHSQVLTPPHYSDVIVTKDLREVWEYVNPQMLYGNHLGLKGNVRRMIEQGDEKTLKLKTRMDALKDRIINENLLQATGLYKFFKARADKNDIVIYDDKTEQEIERFAFPRQTDGLGLCLSDFVPSDRFDSVCMFVVTCGSGVAELAKDLMDKGEFFDSHAISALALESAEGCAELLHKDIRAAWGIPDDPALDIDALFKTKYTGIRVSFGYPACPDLEDQEKMWTLLRPDEKIGVTLSEECMMHPEASVSALVFHHPQARYFSVNS